MNKKVILSFPSRFSVICGFCERNVRGMSCRIAFEFPDFMIDAVIFSHFWQGFNCSFVAGGWVAGSMQKKLGQCYCGAWACHCHVKLGVPMPCGAVRSCRKCGVCGGCGLIVELSSDSKGSSCLTSCQNRGVFLRLGG